MAASQPSACTDAELGGMVLVFRHRLLVFQQSTFVEVQERAHACRQTLMALNVLLPHPALRTHLENNNSEEGASDGDEQKKAEEMSDHSLMAAMPEMPSSNNNNDGLFDLLGDMGGSSFSTDLAAPAATSTFSGPAAGSAAAVAAAALAAQTQLSLATGKEADEAAAKAVRAAREGASTLAALVIEPTNPVHDGEDNSWGVMCFVCLASIFGHPFSVFVLPAGKSTSSFSHVCCFCGSCLLLSFLNPAWQVNPKAQRRVPLPEGLDLAVALNASALDSLYEPDSDLQPATDLSQVSFTQFKFYSEDRSVMGGFGSDDFVPGGEGPDGGWYEFDRKKKNESTPFSSSLSVFLMALAVSPCFSFFKLFIYHLFKTPYLCVLTFMCYSSDWIATRGVGIGSARLVPEANQRA